jgi:hypothetical protein
VVFVFCFQVKKKTKILAKLEEVQANVPTLTQLNSYANDMYSDKIFKEMELMVLKMLNFELNIVTPFQFLDCFFQKNEEETLKKKTVDVILGILHCKKKTLKHRYRDSCKVHSFCFSNSLCYHSK